MQLILLKNVANLGAEHDLVEVKPGYGRNYLIPQGAAVFATPGNLKIREQRLKRVEAQVDELRGQYEEVKKKLEGTKVKVGAKVGESDKIFGSVTNIQVAEAIKTQKGVEIDRKVIVIKEEIKTLGEYEAEITLAGDMVFSLVLEVVSE